MALKKEDWPGDWWRRAGCGKTKVALKVHGDRAIWDISLNKRVEPDDPYKVLIEGVSVLKLSGPQKCRIIDLTGPIEVVSEIGHHFFCLSPGVAG